MSAIVQMVGPSFRPAHSGVTLLPGVNAGIVTSWKTDAGALRGAHLRAMLLRWRDEDPDQQAEDLQALKSALNRNRAGERPHFQP